MLKSVKKVEVDSITISGNDTEQLRKLCELMEGVAQTVIDGEPDKLAEVQNTITFCRKVLKEFK